MNGGVQLIVLHLLPLLMDEAAQVAAKQASVVLSLPFPSPANPCGFVNNGAIAGISSSFI